MQARLVSETGPCPHEGKARIAIGRIIQPAHAPIGQPAAQFRAPRIQQRADHPNSAPFGPNRRWRARRHARQPTPSGLGGQAYGQRFGLIISRMAQGKLRHAEPARRSTQGGQPGSAPIGLRGFALRPMQANDFRLGTMVQGHFGRIRRCLPRVLPQRVINDQSVHLAQSPLMQQQSQ